MESRDQSAGYVVGRLLGSFGIWKLALIFALLVAGASYAVHREDERSRLREQAVADAKVAEKRRALEAQARIVTHKCVDGEDQLLQEARASLKSGDTAEAVRQLEFCDGHFKSAAGPGLLAESRRANEARLARVEAEAQKTMLRYAKSEKARKAKEGVTIGMSSSDVLASSWGQPSHVNRTTTASGTSEQWVYSDNSAYLYFTNGVLTAVQN